MTRADKGLGFSGEPCVEASLADSGPISRVASGFQDLIHRGGSKSHRIDSHIELPRNWLQFSVRVTVRLIEPLPIWFHVRNA